MTLIRAAQRRRAAEVIELRRFDDDAVRHLAGACLGVAADDVPAPVIEQLLRSADGLPLHVEELLAGMVDDRVLVLDGERWTLTAAVSTPVPVSLVATLTGRAERLSSDSVAVLQAAALLGRRFPASVAGVAAGVTETLLPDRLREAVDAQLLVSSPDPEWFEFRHALTAAALQTRLLPMERAAIAPRRAAGGVVGSPDGGRSGAVGRRAVERRGRAESGSRMVRYRGAAGRRTARCPPGSRCWNGPSRWPGRGRAGTTLPASKPIRSGWPCWTPMHGPDGSATPTVSAPNSAGSPRPAGGHASLPCQGCGRGRHLEAGPR
ncbi:hypothetical protein NKG94_00025 [Micromonospora sp. M12]